MHTFIRFFIKNAHSGIIYMDMPMPSGMNLLAMMRAVVTDGYVTHPEFFIPYNEIKYVAIYTAQTQQNPNNVLKLVPDPPKEPA